MSTDSPFQSILAAKVMSDCMDVQPIFMRFGTLRDTTQDLISPALNTCANLFSATRLKPAAEPLDTKGAGSQHPKCPYQGRGNVSYLEIALRHAADAGDQRNDSTKRAKEAADKGPGHTPFLKEGMSAFKHLRMF